jgi:hypothetical protein
LSEKNERLRFTDPRGPYGLSPWWWLLFAFVMMIVIGGIGTAISAAF